MPSADKLNNYTLGRGEMHFGQFKPDTAVPRGERYLGNSPELSYSATQETLDHYNSDRGVRVKDASVTLQQDYAGGFSLDSIDMQNVAYFFMGDASVLTATTRVVTNESHIGVELGVSYQLGVDAANPAGVRQVSGVVVKLAASPGTPVVAGIDYVTDLERGRITVLDSSTVITEEANILVDYSVEPSTREQVVSKGKTIEGSMRYIANNPAGKNIDYYMPWVRISPNGDFNIKGDDWQTLPFTIEILKKGSLEAIYADGVPYVSTETPVDPEPSWDGTLRNSQMVELGDSFIANGTAVTGYENYGMLTAASRLSDQRLVRDISRNLGTGGDSTTMVEARLSQALATGAGVLFVNAGTNDEDKSLSVEDTLASMKRMRDAAVAAETFIVFTTPSPRGNDTYPTKRMTGDALARHLERRTRMLAELPMTGCAVIDTRAAVLKPATENDLVDAFSHDGLHPNPRGADEGWGPAIAATLVALFPAATDLPSGTTASSLNTNVEMTGGGGTTAPTGYTGTNATGTTGVTRTYEEVTTATGNWAQVTIGGVAATAAAAIDLFRQVGVQAVLVPGNVYELVAEYEIDAGAANLLSVQLGMQAYGGSTAQLWDSDRYTEGQPISALAQAGWFRTPRFTAVEGITDFRIRASSYLSTAGAPVGVVRMRNFELREVVQ